MKQTEFPSNVRPAFFTMAFALMLSGNSLMAQVKIGANPAIITPNAVLDVEGISTQRTVILQNGNIGVNQVAPTNKLHVKDTANPLRLEGMQVSTQPRDKSVVVDANGVLKTTTAGAITVFALAGSAPFNTARKFIGETTEMQNEVIVGNTISGASYNQNTNMLTVPSGTYIMTFAMNASIVSSNVTSPLHSYFFDFPSAFSSAARIHSNQSSNAGGTGNHGINITSVVKIANPTSIYVALGWGQGGNMAAGDQISIDGWQFSIIRVAD